MRVYARDIIRNCKYDEEAKLFYGKIDTAHGHINHSHRYVERAEVWELTVTATDNFPGGTIDLWCGVCEGQDRPSSVVSERVARMVMEQSARSERAVKSRNF